MVAIQIVRLRLWSNCNSRQNWHFIFKIRAYYPPLGAGSNPPYRQIFLMTFFYSFSLFPLMQNRRFSISTYTQAIFFIVTLIGLFLVMRHCSTNFVEGGSFPPGTNWKHSASIPPCVVGPAYRCKFWTVTMCSFRSCGSLSICKFRNSVFTYGNLIISLYPCAIRSIEL